MKFFKETRIENAFPWWRWGTWSVNSEPVYRLPETMLVIYGTRFLKPEFGNGIFLLFKRRFSSSKWFSICNRSKNASCDSGWWALHIEYWTHSHIFRPEKYSLTLTFFKCLVGSTGASESISNYCKRGATPIAIPFQATVLGSKMVYAQSKWLLIWWCSLLSGDDMDLFPGKIGKPTIFFTKHKTIGWLHRNPCTLARKLHLHVSSLLQGQLSRFLCAWGEVDTGPLGWGTKAPMATHKGRGNIRIHILKESRVIYIYIYMEDVLDTLILF